MLSVKMVFTWITAVTNILRLKKDFILLHFFKFGARVQRQEVYWVFIFMSSQLFKLQIGQDINFILIGETKELSVLFVIQLPL